MLFFIDVDVFFQVNSKYRCSVVRYFFYSDEFPEKGGIGQLVERIEREKTPISIFKAVYYPIKLNIDELVHPNNHDKKGKIHFTDYPIKQLVKTITLFFSSSCCL